MGDASVRLGSGCWDALVEVLGVMNAQYSDTSNVPVMHFTRGEKKAREKAENADRTTQNPDGSCRTMKKPA